jgi:hypothetical protein
MNWASIDLELEQWFKSIKNSLAEQTRQRGCIRQMIQMWSPSAIPG